MNRRVSNLLKHVNDLMGRSNVGLFWPGVLLLVLAMGGGLIGLLAEQRSRYAVGYVAPQAIVARVAFRAVDPSETEKRRGDARDREPAVYDLNQTYLEQVRDRLKALGRLGADRSITGIEQIPLETRQVFALTPEVLDALRVFHLTVKPGAGPMGASDGVMAGGGGSAGGGAGTNTATTQAGAWDQLVDRLLEKLAEVPVLEGAQARMERDPAQRAPKIITRLGSQRTVERYDHLLLSVDEDVSVLRERLQAMVIALGFPRAVWNSLLTVVLSKPAPTYVFNFDETRRRKELAFEMEPAVERGFSAQEVLIKAGKTLTDFDVRALVEEQRAYHAGQTALETWLRQCSLAGLILVLGVGLWLYIYHYNVRIALNPMRGLALTGLILLCQGLALLLADFWPGYAVAAAAFATLLATIILAIAYDPRLAVTGGCATVLIVAVTLHLSLGQTFVLIVGAGVAAALLDQVRTRSKILTTGGWAGLAMSACALMVSLIDRPLDSPEQWRALRLEAIVALAAGVLTGLVVQGLLPAIEKAFRVTTAMTLKDLHDAAHPLLRRLAQEAPGTYQHSLRLADLAEAAADAIGCNSLLCKVGAMYHDVGKLTRPDHFVENQGEGPNRHLSLSPMESGQVIIGHVADGVNLARQHKLPTVIRHMIESHHGTTLVEYFYHATRQQAEAKGQMIPPESDYRYPGPKPLSREAAILMLCDSIESAARAMVQPDAHKLEDLVHNLAAKRQSDGQFDQCNLTLAEFHKAQDAIIRTLTAMYHARIAYPIEQARLHQNQRQQAGDVG